MRKATTANHPARLSRSTAVARPSAAGAVAQRRATVMGQETGRSPPGPWASPAVFARALPAQDRAAEAAQRSAQLCRPPQADRPAVRGRAWAVPSRGSRAQAVGPRPKAQLAAAPVRRADRPNGQSASDPQTCHSSAPVRSNRVGCGSRFRQQVRPAKAVDRVQPGQRRRGRHHWAARDFQRLDGEGAQLLLQPAF